jgi:hypothetical protein
MSANIGRGRWGAPGQTGNLPLSDAVDDCQLMLLGWLLVRKPAGLQLLVLVLAAASLKDNTCRSARALGVMQLLSLR